MDTATVRRLRALNRQFYTDHGRDFSATRARLQLGVTLLLKSLKGEETILDLGCGNGELARTLSRRGHHGAYLGLDFSLPLLKEAGRAAFAFPVKFEQADLASADWEEGKSKKKEERDFSLPPSHFDLVFAFAVLHHVPSRELRLNIIQKVHELLAANGRFILSNWQFLNSPRGKARIQPWDTIGLTTGEVDSNDYLLDWKHGGLGLRYVHYFDEAELAELAKASGFEIIETFYSDGANRRSSLYQIWKKA